jgi:antitoxin component of MazEF toxin-antitoxin module
MGYKVKIQRVERGSTQSFYVNFPAAIAEAANIAKGEEMEWSIENKNTFILLRVKPAKERILKKIARNEEQAGGKTSGRKAKK